MYRRAIEVRQQLNRKYPGTPEYLRDLGSIYNNAAFFELMAGRLPEAEAGFRQALAIQEPLVQPTSQHCRVPAGTVQLVRQFGRSAVEKKGVRRGRAGLPHGAPTKPGVSLAVPPRAALPACSRAPMKATSPRPCPLRIETKNRWSGSIARWSTCGQRAAGTLGRVVASSRMAAEHHVQSGDDPGAVGTLLRCAGRLGRVPDHGSTRATGRGCACGALDAWRKAAAARKPWRKWRLWPRLEADVVAGAHSRPAADGEQQLWAARVLARAAEASADRQEEYAVRCLELLRTAENQRIFQRA